jgi:diguanylate cyclase (GGDEF)-like protein
VLPPPREDVYFEQRDRVRLWFKVTELLPDYEDRDEQVSGDGMAFLEEFLRRNLGKLQLAAGGDAGHRIQSFIMNASQNELLDVIQLVPIARFAAHKEYLTRFYHRGVARHLPAPQESQHVMDVACSELNTYLASTSSPARFAMDGTFHRDSFVPEVPIALSKLPPKEQLRSDLEIRCGENSPTALVFVDLDNFKLVNDSKGHLAGDACLVKVVEILGGVAAMRGKVYRYGGDEFVVVFPNCTTPEAMATAERIRLEIDQANVAETVKVTASIGVAATDRVGHLAEDLIAKGDQAMYVSKQNGRNKVTGYEV